VSGVRGEACRLNGEERWWLMGRTDVFPVVGERESEFNSNQMFYLKCCQRHRERERGKKISEQVSDNSNEKYM